MSLIFSVYLAAFWLIHRRQRTVATALIAAATVASLGMFLYHADSSLGLNF